MTKAQQSEPAALSAAAAVARAPNDWVLRRALVERCHQEGRPILGSAINLNWGVPSSETSLGGWAYHLAGALVARLRADGAAELAGEVASLIEGEGFPLIFGDVVDVEDVKDWAQPSLHLPKPLRKRLELDAHHGLVVAFDELIEKHRRSYVPPPPSWPPFPPPPRMSWRGETSEERALTDQLAAAYDSRSLFIAILARLHGEGEDVVVGLLMLGWTFGVAGPIVNPRDLVNALVLRYRVPPPQQAHEGWPEYEINPELAQEIADLFDKAPIDRYPNEILDVWTREIAGPLIQAGPLAAALVEELRCSRREDHQRLARLLLPVLQKAEPPILGPDGSLPKAAP
jgi:hypothetical protein